MANRPQVSNWNNVNSNKPEEYSSEFAVDGNRYANVTNVSTGQRQLYLVSGRTPLTQRTLLTSTTADGNITKGEGYDDFIRTYGQSKLTNAEINNKRQSNFIIGKAGTQQEVENLKGSSQYKSGLANTASNPATGDSTASSNVTDNDIIKSVGDGGVRGTYGNYSYPITRDTNQDYIKFTMFRYSPSTLTTSGVGEGESASFSKQGKGSALGTVSLPIQPSITDTNQVVWGEDRLNAFQAMAGKLSLAMIAGGDSTEKEVNNAGGELKAASSDIKSNIAATAAKAAIATNSNIFTRQTGAIINPNLELLFQGPGLRTFTFNFSLSAREEKEAQEIRKIIRFFKQGMSVKRASTSLYLKSPNTFKISYIYGGTGSDHPWINRIKECALQNFTVNYTPAQNYATYEDGAMTQYDLSLTFGELDPIYDDDYTALPGGDTDTSPEYQIGY